MTPRTTISSLKFCGRTSEIEALIARWRLASDIAHPRTQVVIIKSERGLGKTRLALEFYKWLSEHVDGWLTKTYWPDALEIVDKNLEVNPDPHNCKFEVPIPYLWWGLRVADRGAENGVTGDAIATYDRYLAPHLVALLVQTEKAAVGWSLAKAWADVGLDLGASAVHVDAILSVGRGLVRTAQIVLGAVNETARQEAMERSISRADTVLSDLEKVFKPKTITYAKAPGVIFLDDAQFLDEDAALPTFVERLLHNSVVQRWPLLILVTHWKAELSPELAKTEYSFAGILRHARRGSPTENGPAAGLPGGYLTDDHFAEIDLNPVADLSGALRDKLPGLTQEQSTAILAQMGGNPRFLEQVIAFLVENENFFEDLKPDGRLTPDGLEQTLKETHSQDIFKVVLRRLRGAPEDVQEAICLASLQGIRFVNDLVDTLGRSRLGRAVREPLRKGEDPYCMLVGTKSIGTEPLGQFAERLFHQVAQQRRQGLKSLGGEPALQNSFKETIVELVLDPGYPKTASTEGQALVCGIAAGLFERSSNPRERSVAQKALGELARLEMLRNSFESAAVAWQRLLAIEPSSHSFDSLEAVVSEYSSRIKTWEALALTYRNLNWPAKAARALRNIFAEATHFIPDGYDLFLRSIDKAAAVERFDRWKQENPNMPVDLCIWFVGKIVDALLSLGELARARPSLRVDDGDEPTSEWQFLIRLKPVLEAAENPEEAHKDLTPDHVLQAMFLVERAYALGGILGSGEAERKHFRLLEELAQSANLQADLATAEGLLLRALQISRDLGDELAKIATLSNLGMTAGRKPDLSAADNFLEQARVLVDAIFAEDAFLVDLVPDEKGTVEVWAANGEISRDTSAPRSASRVVIPGRYSTEFGENPDTVMRKVGTLKQLAANVYGNLGANALQQGALPLAKERFLRALSTHQEILDLENMTLDLRNLGKIAHLEGDLASACSHWGRCVEIFRELERRDAGSPLAPARTKAIEEMLDGMRASGCTVAPFVEH